MKSLVLCDNEDLAAVLPVARREGLGIEVQSFYHPEILNSPSQEVDRHKGLLVGFSGLRAFHGPFADLCPGSSDPLVRQLAAQRIEQSLPLAGKLDATHLILHHGYTPNTSYPPNWIKRSTDFWQTILAKVPPTAHVHLENHLDGGPEVLLAVVQKVEDPRLGICLDIGHAHAISRTPLVDWVRTLGGCITYVHLHDNHGDKDEHLPFGEGNLPLREVLDALETYAPEAIWAIETDVIPSLAWLAENGYR